MKEYKIFLKKGEALEENKEIEIDIVNQETFQRHKVKAIISSSLDNLPDGDMLWLQDEDAIRPRFEQPWVIKIIGEKEEEKIEAKLPPKVKVSLGERRGDMLKTMIQERGGDKR